VSGRVLIADDNAVDRALLARMLECEGYAVHAVADGSEAVAAFAELRPDLVLLDALMPGVDGFAAARAIKAQAVDRFVPLIFLTSLSDAGELARCLEVGGDDFVCKPYNAVILRAKLRAFERMAGMHAEVLQARRRVEQVNAHLVREQAVAKAVHDNVIRPRSLAINNLKHHLSPLAIFNGDVLLATRHAGGGMFVFLGDFTGHGLPAAIGAMPTADIFYGMAAKGFALPDIVHEINAKLRRILPVGIFCCASMVELDFRKGLLHAWHGGLPDAYVYRYRDRSVTHVTSRHLPLGVLAPGAFDGSVQTIEVAAGDRIFMCSDGILEAQDAGGRMFGAARLDAVFDAGHAPDDVFQAVRQSVLDFLHGTPPQDDFTMLEASVVDEATLDAPVPVFGADDEVGAEDWQLSYELGSRSLRAFNPLPLLQQVLTAVPGLRRRAGELYTVLSELYSNALEHGVLGLDSSLKATPRGFAEYYALRAQRLAALEDARIRFEFRHEPGPLGGELAIRVVDSGPGFDHRGWQERSLQAAGGELCGRGIPLLAQLCASIEYGGRGNEVTALYRWRHAA
jgi:CheY-like chemotaxis protein/anti-sigma regulatory factor (Ser/Thr protein kinase)